MTARPTREQAKRTEARIRQLLSPPNSDQESDEDIEERVARDVRKERVVKKCKRSEGVHGNPVYVRVSSFFHG
jgi:hypothetical protein